MLSVTRLGTANACLKKYHFAYEYGGAGLEPREKSLPLTLGSLVHASLEAFYRGDALPPLEGAGELLDQAREAVGTYTLYARLRDRFDVVDVERRFEVVFEDTLFTGAIDAVVRVDGQLYLLEHKAQPLTTGVLTPDGWRKMGDLQPGDLVMGRDGLPHTVTGVYPQGVVPTYRVTFSDRTSVDCADEHLWAVTALNGGAERVLSTRQILAGGVKNRQCRYAVPLVQPLHFPEKSLPLDPYLLGVLLGDGCLRGIPTVTVGRADEEMLQHITAASPWRVRQRLTREGVYAVTFNSGGKLIDALYELNLYGTHSRNKFIPEQYLFSGVEQRLALLRGLMDTDGSVAARRPRFVSVSRHLAEGVQYLVQSLGGVATLRFSKPGHYVVTVRMPQNPFLLSRKRQAFELCGEFSETRRIVSIERIEDVAQQCITVDSPDHLYVTEHCVVTHNTCSQFWPVNREVLAPQHVLYELAAEEIYGEPVAGTIYNFIRLTKRRGEHHAEVRRVIIPADEEVRLSHYNDAADTLELMRLSKLRPRNVGPHCGSCDFASLCIADLRREDTHDLATRDFLRKESHEPALSP